ncbi:SGNH/GDSL hydrolase family protein [Bradyrhizobium sp. 44]|uniref:SGNH/GDSL hydrolase family protein n=1 Tax=Bradyrhizobium sp. 44 TaxID=2782675 RepID=UPI001FFBA5C7|nr:SGNH/GDSL hydrolase family protein [Bradyrhizobium sp. 44]MCK1285427.1 SGNH/GDSL hydrolase family protein [Bradyrhizobium sp. 44]
MVAAACLIAAAASFSEIQRLKGRIGQLTRHEFHDHSDVREFIITAAVADVLDPIFVLGDSITEMAPLPRKICGRQVINAGIGGQTIREAERIAKRVIGERGAYLVALALGANDVGSSSVRSDFTALIDAVKPLAKRPPVALAVTSDPATSREIAAAAAARGIDFVTPVLPRGSLMSDYIHYRAAAYEVWVPALEAAITKECSEF